MCGCLCVYACVCACNPLCWKYVCGCVFVCAGMHLCVHACMCVSACIYSIMQTCAFLWKCVCCVWVYACDLLAKMRRINRRYKCHPHILRHYVFGPLTLYWRYKAQSTIFEYRFGSNWTFRRSKETEEGIGVKYSERYGIGVLSLPGRNKQNKRLL